MLCHSCGAPMTLYRERGYFHCEYCGAYHFPAETRDGIRLLGPAPEKLPCPVCGENLYIALLDDVYRGHQCPQCRGLLLETAVFRDVVQRRRAAATEPPEPPQPRNLTELERRLPCPRCRQTMDAHPYYGPGNIIIDTCNTCHTLGWTRRSWRAWSTRRATTAALHVQRGCRRGVPWWRPYRKNPSKPASPWANSSARCSAER